MNTFTLISYKLCPYVQRVAITLAEKQIPFNLVYIDLDAPPDWFKDISPLGKVPLLKIGHDGNETVLFESSVICEFIEDLGTGRKLHPAAPIERARHRAWMEFGSAVLGDIWQIEIATDQAGHDKARASLDTKFARLETVLDGGPFFDGSEFSLVDAVFAPAFRYFDVMDRLAGGSFTSAFPKVSAWRKNLLSRESVRGAVVEQYPELLHIFLRAKQAWIVQNARS